MSHNPVMRTLNPRATVELHSGFKLFLHGVKNKLWDFQTWDYAVFERKPKNPYRTITMNKRDRWGTGGGGRERRRLSTGRVRGGEGRKG